MKHEVARKSIFAQVCYFSLSLSLLLSFCPCLNRVSVRLKGWLTDWLRRDEPLQGILERIALARFSDESRAQLVQWNFCSLGFTLESWPLLRQVCFGNYAASSFIRVRRPSSNLPLLLSPRGIQGVETEADISLSVSCFRSHSEIRPLIRRARRNMHMLALGLVVHQGYSSSWGHSNCFSSFLFFNEYYFKIFIIDLESLGSKVLVILFQSSWSYRLFQNTFYLSSFQSLLTKGRIVVIRD